MDTPNGYTDAPQKEGVMSAEGTCRGCGDFCNDGSGAGRCERCQANEINYGPYEFEQDRWA